MGETAEEHRRRSRARHANGESGDGEEDAHSEVVKEAEEVQRERRWEDGLGDAAVRRE